MTTQTQQVIVYRSVAEQQVDQFITSGAAFPFIAGVLMLVATLLLADKVLPPRTMRKLGGWVLTGASLAGICVWYSLSL